MIAKPMKKMPNVGMAQIEFVSGDEAARCVVGSCIALVLYCRHSRIGCLAHIVLPNSSDAGGPPGKFADTAVPYILKELALRGVDPRQLTAKIVGGASMFGSDGPIQIGRRNIEAVTHLVHEKHVAVVGTHVSGSKGRRVTFECGTGDVTIEIGGEEAEKL